jgi:hypothetical protein
MQPGVLAAIAIVAIAGAALWAVALVDVFQRPDREFPSRGLGANARLFWTFVVVCGSSLGSLLYYLMVMKPYPRRRR